MLAGRILLSTIFLLSGAMKLMNWSNTANQMSEEGMVAVPLFLTLAVLFELVGGLSVLLGFRARLGALALVAFLVPVTLVFHDFWAFEGKAMQDQMQHFMKNLTIIGGLLVVAGAGPGRLALDALRTRAPARERDPLEAGLPLPR
jgi:putative oxidoreductase